MEGHRRRSSIDPAFIESILTSGVSTHPAAAPNPHVGNSPNRAHFAMEPPPLPPPKHSRAMSYNPRRPNRLSLSFPVVTGRNSNDSTRPTPTSSSSLSFPPTPSECLPAPSPADPSGFLNALASQERRVLELKEELEKAEADLSKLKRQWAVHEAHKKKAEIRHVEQLQPLQMTPKDTKFNEDGTIMTRQSAELDRRKTLLSSINTKEPRRKVISGGHTRTLSLLSPERSTYSRPFPPVREVSGENANFPRSTTMPDTSQEGARVGKYRARPISYHGGITHGAKQVAEDVKAGLWTFLEDLRQATVGDEIIVNGAASRGVGVDGASNGPVIRKSSKSSLVGADKSRNKGNGNQNQNQTHSPRSWDSLTGGNSALLDAAGHLWPEKSKAPHATPSKKSRTLSLAAPALDDDDDWSNWDSPAPAPAPVPKSPRWSGSTTISDNPSTSSSIDDRAVKILEQLHNGTSTPEMQWPVLDKLTPGNLKRTVSGIMEEWEKSLTPPPGREEDEEERVRGEEVALMSR